MMNTPRFLAGTFFLLGALCAASAAPADPPLLPPDMFANLLNAPPVYPAASQGLREQGRVVVQVLVSRAGEPLQVGIGQSSGFNRLDRAALDAVQGWHFTAGAQEDATAQHWFSVPINFALAEPREPAALPVPVPMAGLRGEN